jgi:hypothetical protein
MGVVKSVTGGYGLGFVLFAVVAAACLAVRDAQGRARGTRRVRVAEPTA